MIAMFNTTLGRLRVIALIEGVSFLLLLGIAMPLKYMAGIPIAVKVAGWIHGVLFIGFCLALMQVWSEHDWPLKRVATTFVAALLPFGPFVLDRRLAAEQQPADGNE